MSVILLPSTKNIWICKTCCLSHHVRLTSIYIGMYLIVTFHTKLNFCSMEYVMMNKYKFSWRYDNIMLGEVCMRIWNLVAWPGCIILWEYKQIIESTTVILIFYVKSKKASWSFELTHAYCTPTIWVATECLGQD